MKSESVTIQMKAIEQYFPEVMFIMLYKVVGNFHSVDEILKCDHYQIQVIESESVMRLYPGRSNFTEKKTVISSGIQPKVVLSQIKFSAQPDFQSGSKHSFFICHKT